MRYLIWYFLRFLWSRTSLNAFTVIIYIEKYLTATDKRDTGEYLKRAGEDAMEREKNNGNRS